MNAKELMNIRALGLNFRIEFNEPEQCGREVVCTLGDTAAVL